MLVNFKQRDDYRTFWKDRINSVRAWYSVLGDVKSSGFDEHYTVRGLEAYVFSSAQEQSQQRDLYTYTVLQEQDCERIKPKLEVWSAKALERAQIWAAQDAQSAGIEQPTRCFSTAANHDDFNCITPPESPASVVGDGNVVDNRWHVKDMNKRLIKQMLEQQQLQGQPRKKQRRDSALGQQRNSMHQGERPGTSSLYQQDVNYQTVMGRNSIQDQRRTNLALGQQSHGSSGLHQPQEQTAQVNHKMSRRDSIADDYEQHMKFCNQLLNHHHQVAQRHNRGVGHRDSLALAVQHTYQLDYSKSHAVFQHNIRPNALSFHGLRYHGLQDPCRGPLTFSGSRRDSLSMHQQSATDDHEHYW